LATGVVFCRRDDFSRVGGYAAQRHYGGNQRARDYWHNDR
jgi:hypothetical protein